MVPLLYLPSLSVGGVGGSIKAGFASSLLCYIYIYIYIRYKIAVSRKFVGKTRVIAGIVQRVCSNHSTVTINDRTVRPEITFIIFLFL